MQLARYYPDDLLNADQAADHAGVRPSTIRQWHHRGLLHPAIPGDGRTTRHLYGRQDVDAAIAELARREAEREAAWQRAA
ncbi:hypothetical protein GCM10010406_21220 [Streptomyces thermolineatus]|uniref:HTH merR-type domain-containing protein n=1 Tax=Streptomyces thermolineatus TaxID=44033 RepID=A0ABN3LI91_9ACTN